jgi:hypothetical protein
VQSVSVLNNPSTKKLFVFCPRDRRSTFSTRRSSQAAVSLPTTSQPGSAVAQAPAISPSTTPACQALSQLHSQRHPDTSFSSSKHSPNTDTHTSPTATVLLANDSTAPSTTKQHHPPSPYPGAFQRTTLLPGPVSPKQPPRPSSCITNNSITSSKPCRIAL